jgi:hypothetical protein
MKYPTVTIKSDYGNYITIVLDEYFEEDNIVESIIKLDNTTSIVNFSENINNNKLDNFFNEFKLKDVIYLNYHNQIIEFSLLEKKE